MLTKNISTFLPDIDFFFFFPHVSSSVQETAQAPVLYWLHEQAISCSGHVGLGWIRACPVAPTVQWQILIAWTHWPALELELGGLP